MILKDGVNVGDLIKILKQLPQDKPVIIASDEEGNTLYKGLFIEHYEDIIQIAGLSGCEFRDHDLSDEDFKAIQTHGQLCKCESCIKHAGLKLETQKERFEKEAQNGSK